MANSVVSTLDALGAHHYWIGGEATGDFVDSGSVGGFDLDTYDTPSTVWRQAPGVPNGLPLTYGFWPAGYQNNGPDAYFAGGWAETTATIVIGGWIRWFQAISGSRGTSVLIQNNLNNGGIWSGLWVDQDGSLVMTSRGNSDTKRIDARSAAGAITAGQAHFVCGVQRGDGNGLRVYVDGVDVTDSQSNVGVTVDAWDNETKTVGWTPTRLGPRNGQGYSGTPAANQGSILVSVPFCFIDAVISDDDIAALAAAGNLNAVSQDYHSTVCNLIGDFNGDSGEVIYWWLCTLAGDSRSAIGSPGDKLLNTAVEDADFEQDTNIVSPFYYGKINYDDTNDVLRDGSSGNLLEAAAPSTGTINIIGRIVTASAGQTYLAFSFGSGGGAGEEMHIGIGGSSIGISVIYDIYHDGGTDRYREVYFDGRFAIDTPLIMITVVQDGSGVQLYVDGQPVSGTVTQAGAFSASTWFSDLIPLTTSPNTSWGGDAGSATVRSWLNDLMDSWVTTKALSAAEVAEIWDAYNGIFPTPDPPPDGFFNELANTGNESEPNGPGPDWWWRCNQAGAPLVDTGIAQDRAGPTPPAINADTILENGDPTYEAPGPLPDDVTDDGVYLDGIGDSFEVGVNGASGELADTGTGSVGGFIARNSVGLQIMYSQADDAGAAFWRLGINSDNVAELVVQTSAGNSVTVTGSTVLDRAYHLILATSDGTSILLYVDGALEARTVVTAGTGADGDWFDAFTATRSALGALADSGFSSTLTGRISEVFIYDGYVLSASQILNLWQAAIRDGITGVAAETGVISFEDVIFRNGQFADVLARNADTTFLQVLKFNNCEFLDGAEGTATYRPQLVRAEGNAQVQVHASRGRFPTTPTFGRGGIVGSQIDTSAAATLYGSLIVVDCDFDQIGYVDGTDLLAPVMAEAGFGLTAYSNRFRDVNGAAVAWLSDAQRVIVSKNLVGTVQNALAAIYAGNAANTNIGTAWLINGNDLLDSSAAGIELHGANLDGDFARNVRITRNLIKAPTTRGMLLDELGDLAVLSNEIEDPTEGIRLGEIEGKVLVRRNAIRGNSGTGIILAEAAFQVAELGILGNEIDGENAGDGITVGGIREVVIVGNALKALSIGMQIGNVNLGAHIDKNYVDATTPFALLGGSSQVGLDIGRRNTFRTLGAAGILTVAAEAEITKIAGYHQITAGAAQDLETINDPGRVGDLLILRLAAGSSTITVKDAVDNIRLAGGADFAMDAESDQLWLVRNADGNWHELAQQGT